ncbi:hypothetical protein BTS2_3759 [Bacillus sp. TS-2]|nr:hypothetical protein BTS2_3759 [Bacillus sp. TS-2]
MGLDWLEIIILALATFRFTHLLVFDKITNFIRKPFQHIKEERMENGEVVEYVSVKGTGIRKFIGEILSCYWCTGIWMACVLFFLYSWLPVIMGPILIIFAIAGIAAFLEAILNR